MPVASFQRAVLPNLPPLAWLFEHQPGTDGKLTCGSAVDIDENGFFEGCWAAYESDDITKMSHVFGTGLRIKDNRWIFINPSHTLEFIFVYRHSKGWSVSNSFSFLIAYHNIKIPWDPKYGRKFVSICRGIEDYEKSLFRTSDGEVFRLAYDNVEIDDNGQFKFHRKPMPPEFPDFKSYANFLTDIMRLAFENAKKRGSYEPISTCSSGYDSACASVLAAKLGCKEAITLKNSRGGDDDSGKAIGELLGLKVHEFERPDMVEESFERAAPFLATGMGGEDYCYCNFAPVLKKKVVLTGFHGDKSWGANSKPDSVLGRADLCGCSIQEFRLWHDFIHLPVPTIGSRRQPEVVKLAKIPEMVPWRLNRPYDRPVPRRILEEAGVPRTSFGQSKKAASILLFFEPRLFPAAVRKQCEAAVDARSVMASKYGISRLVWESRFAAFQTLRTLEEKVPGLRGVTKAKRAIVGEWRLFEHSNPRSVVEFLAAVEVVGKRYRQALQQPAAARLEQVV